MLSSGERVPPTSNDCSRLSCTIHVCQKWHRLADADFAVLAERGTLSHMYSLNTCLSMMCRRKYYGDTEGQVKIPSVTQTALVWGLFMGTSSNVRYQTVFGLERAVDLTIAKKIPQAAYVATIVIRFINNIIGGENFIDMARWAGVQ